ncbi:MAG TPA: SRPBCC domain-containing protein [Candidatus Limnocylindrales bacterium]|nr:SRPBCC domain-containing protein [Candidatus Limnocylindrales bacterium]
MELSGTAEIAATRAATWDLLMDVDRLARCGPDVDSIERQDATHAKVRATVGSGFMKAGVTIDLELSEIEPPDRIAVRGSGEAAGNQLVATGHVVLSGPPEGPTTMAWATELEVTGPLAGMARRMIEGAASNLVEETIDCIRTTLTAG